MPLLSVPLPAEVCTPPRDVHLFLREAERRIARFVRSHHVPAFVPSDYPAVYAALQALEERDLAPGRWFCEWGSGFGVVACLAALLGFESRGIEAEGELVDAARRLAADFGLPVEFARGSFFPTAALPDPSAPGCAWLNTDVASGYEELDLGPEDFDVIFAYPWPDEERVIARLFARHARAEALLLTHHASGEVRLQRQAPGRKR